jgi:hypothetical protein
MMRDLDLPPARRIRVVAAVWMILRGWILVGDHDQAFRNFTQIAVLARGHHRQMTLPELLVASGAVS